MSDSSDSEDDVRLIKHGYMSCSDDELTDEFITYEETEMDKMANKMSYNLTGLSLRGLVGDIVKNLKVTYGGKAEEHKEVKYSIERGDFGLIAHAIAAYCYDGMVDPSKRTEYDNDFKLLVSNVSNKIHYGMTDNVDISGYKGLVPKVLSELPKRLKLKL